MLNPDRILPHLASANHAIRLAAVREADEALHTTEAEQTAVDWASLTASLLPALVHSLGDPVKGVQVHAANCLQLLLRRTGAVAPALRAALTDPEVRRARGAAIVAARAGLWYPEMAGVLGDAMGAADRDIRWAAANLITELGRTVPAAVAVVRAVLRQGSPVARRMAAYTLGTLGAVGAYARAEADLLQALSDPVPEVRRAGILALAKLPARSGATVTAIAALQSDPEPFVARTAAAVTTRLYRP